jgi:hypothetical protein
MWSAKVHRPKNVLKGKTHFCKWGRMQGMERNDSQVHSLFGKCTHVGVMNVYSLGWKGKQAPNWALKTPLKKS